MQQVTQSLKERMRNGEILISLRTTITMDRPQLEAALGKSSYDFIYVDCQHWFYTEEQLVTFCANAEALGYPVEIRIPHTRQAYLVGRFCDLGPAAILVPEVKGEHEVDEAVDFFYYPPVGKRSVGGPARYGLDSGQFDRRSYAQWWNERGILGIQLESVEAIINARQLAKPGVTYVAFGPNDLEFSLEAHPEFPLNTVDVCMRHVSQQLAGTGIPLGMAIVEPPEDRQKYLEMGVTVFQEFPNQSS